MLVPKTPGRADFPPLPSLPSPWREARDAADIILTRLWLGTCHAKWLAGDRGLSSEWVVPSVLSSEEDMRMSPDFVLIYLAQIWILSDEADLGARRLQQAIPFLRKSRANLGQPPITVAGISAGSWGEWLLRTAQAITHFGEPVGCGPLIRMVLNAYPREDVAADPWQFGSVVGAWRSRLIPEQTEIAALVHTAAAGYVRSEFCRRLMTWGQVDKALDAVQFGPLCEWVRRAFGAINFVEMRHALEMEFSAALEAFPNPPRLSVDADTNTIILDGISHKSDPHGVAVIKAMLEAKVVGELPASSKRIRERIPGCHHDTTFRRWRDALPEAIRECIKHKDGTGLYLELPPL